MYISQEETHSFHNNVVFLIQNIPENIKKTYKLRVYGTSYVDNSNQWQLKMYTTRKSYGLFGKHNGNTYIRHSNLLEMAWHQPHTSIVTLMHLSHVVLCARNTICNVSNSRYNLDCTGMYHFLCFVYNLPQHPGYPALHSMCLHPCEYLINWYPIQNLLHFYKSFLLKLRKTWS